MEPASADLHRQAPDIRNVSEERALLQSTCEENARGVEEMAVEAKGRTVSFRRIDSQLRVKRGSG